MEFDIWKPLYVDEFDCDKYLYHYTSFETAIKIIYSNQLLFSLIGRTNDTSESKMKIVFGENNIVDKDIYRKQVNTIFPSKYSDSSIVMFQYGCENK